MNRKRPGGGMCPDTFCLCFPQISFLYRYNLYVVCIKAIWIRSKSRYPPERRDQGPDYAENTQGRIQDPSKFQDKKKLWKKWRNMGKKEIYTLLTRWGDSLCSFSMMVKLLYDGLLQKYARKCSAMTVKWVYDHILISTSLMSILPALAWSKPSFAHLTIIEKLHQLGEEGVTLHFIHLNFHPRRTENKYLLHLEFKKVNMNNKHVHSNNS